MIPGRREGRESLFSGHRVSTWDDGESPGKDKDKDDDRTALCTAWLCNATELCTFVKRAKMVNFMIPIVYHNLKKKERKKSNFVPVCLLSKSRGNSMLGYLI